MDTGTILVTEAVPVPKHPVSSKVAVYTRVSSAENKSNLDSQAERLVAYCAVRGYQVSKVVKEIGSGVNDNRSKFLALLADPSTGRIVIEHKDRGTRFGFRYIETLLNTYGRTIEVVNQAENSTEDLQAAQRFCLLGVTPNKSYVGSYPHVPQEVWWHYFRGILDGDGNIYFSRKHGLRITIVGNRNCIVGLHSDLSEMFSLCSHAK